MKILVVGSGAREYTLAWSLARSPDVTAITAAPGNGGIHFIPKTGRVALDSRDVPALVALARREAMDMVVVGPEDALAAGLTDALAAAGIPAFGPSRRAACLEISKTFAKQFMQKHGVPTADSASFQSLDRALAYVDACDHDIVIKADGLAAGKGVVLPESREEARMALSSMLEQRRFGAAGETVLVEERLTGWEVSVFALSDGQDYCLFGHAQDYKRIFDGGRGPNTGGMGTCSPSPLSPTALQEIDRRIVAPTFAGLARDNRAYTGILFFGLMMTEEGPQVLEYNARLGDPETQVLLPRLQDSLVEAAWLCTQGRLHEVDLAWSPRVAVSVVMASAGYPGAYRQGLPIRGLAGIEEASSLVFCAGVEKKDNGTLVTAGGRVLSVVGLGPDQATARQRAYARVRTLHFDGVQYRQDIGASKAAAS